MSHNHKELLVAEAANLIVKGISVAPDSKQICYGEQLLTGPPALIAELIEQHMRLRDYYSGIGDRSTRELLHYRAAGLLYKLLPPTPFERLNPEQLREIAVAHDSICRRKGNPSYAPDAKEISDEIALLKRLGKHFS